LRRDALFTPGWDKARSKVFHVGAKLPQELGVAQFGGSAGSRALSSFWVVGAGAMHRPLTIQQLLNNRRAHGLVDCHLHWLPPAVLDGHPIGGNFAVLSREDMDGCTNLPTGSAVLSALATRVNVTCIPPFSVG